MRFKDSVIIWSGLFDDVWLNSPFVIPLLDISASLHLSISPSLLSCHDLQDLLTPLNIRYLFSVPAGCPALSIVWWVVIMSYDRGVSTPLDININIKEAGRQVNWMMTVRGSADTNKFPFVFCQLKLVRSSAIV